MKTDFFSKAALDNSGRVVLGDAALTEIEAMYDAIPTAAGMISTNHNCSGNNANCTNTGDCSDTTNAGCNNKDTCFAPF